MPPVLPEDTVPDAMAPRTMRILVADDCPDMRQLFRDILGERHDVFLVPDGKAAIEALHSEGVFHAVVSDLEMPHADGTQVIHEAGKHGVPIRILASGLGIDHLRSIVRDATVRLLPKPFKIPQLYSALSVA